MYFIIYISKAVQLMQQDDLVDLLTSSRDKNATHNVTGMLLYLKGNILGHIEGRFIQVLEGSEQEVKKIFDIIKNDNRHQNVSLLNQGNLKKRNFKTWQMGFETINADEVESWKGFFELNEQFLDSGNSQGLNIALSFLKQFYLLSLKQSKR